MMSSTALDVPLYSVGEAARLLRMRRPSKLWRWLDGYTTPQGAYSPPVIRPEPNGRREVSWAEFIEAGFLSQYRVRQVTLQQIRPVIERMRREFGVPYPLAHFRPLVDHSARKMVLRLQDEEHLDDRLAIIRLHDGQLQFGEAIQPFLEQIDFEGAVAMRWHPLGREGRVTVDPDLAFGVPQIRGVRTEVICEAFLASGSREEAARGWELSLEEVDAALRFELLLEHEKVA